MMDDPDHLRTGPRWLDAACHRRGMGGRGGRRSGGGGRRVAPPYDVNNLGAKLTLWLDGVQRVTLTGSEVTAWGDSQTQNTARNFTGSAGTAPVKSTINGLSVVDFPGTDEVMDTTGTVAQIVTSSGYEYLAVLKVRSVAKNSAAYSGNDGVFVSNDAGYFYCALRNNAGVYTVGCGHFDGADKVATQAITLNQALLVHAYHDGASITARVGAGTASSVAAGAIANTAGAMRIGASRFGVSEFSDIQLAELVVCNATLSADERSSARAYLGNKWGVTT